MVDYKRDKEEMMIELRGKAVADVHKAALQDKLQTLATQGFTLKMAVLLVGGDHGAKMYAAFMEKTARAAGLDFVRVELPEMATHDEVAAAMQALNDDDSVNGILPLLPMPKQVKSATILELMDPTKDIDGLTMYNAGLLVSGKGGFPPCTAKACMAILEHYNIPIQGKHVVVLGRSQVIGKPIALMTLAENGTVTICHSKTPDLESFVKQGDIIIAAVGRAHMITGDMLKPGAVVLDVGINELDGKTVGDVDYDSAVDVAGAITPVPGGVGSVTTTMMLEAVYEAYHARNVNR